MSTDNLFQRELEDALADPEFRAEYVRESVRIATIDRIVNALDDARAAQGMSKASLARAVGSDPAAMRRLFTTRGNPTLGTLAEIAAVLGLQVALAPMPRREARAIRDALADAS